MLAGRKQKRTGSGTEEELTPWLPLIIALVHLVTLLPSKSVRHLSFRPPQTLRSSTLMFDAFYTSAINLATTTICLTARGQLWRYGSKDGASVDP